MNTYYIVRITINGKRFFLLWNCDCEPVFLTDENGGAVFFGSLAELNTFAEKNGIELDEEITGYDLDNITVTAETLDCNGVIEKWNIISDLALTVGAEFSGEDKRYNGIYDKLFYGCNLPAMKHPRYTPEWGEEEIAEINRILAEGAELCRRIFICNSPKEN